MEAGATLLVPVGSGPATIEAVEVAATVAKARRGRVHLVYVIEVGRSLPLNAELDQESRRAEQFTSKAEAVAAQAGCQVVRSSVVQAREAGPAILEEALAQRAEAIVLGLPAFQGEDRPFALGATAEYLLRHAPCEVWLIRQQVRELRRPGRQEHT